MNHNNSKTYQKAQDIGGVDQSQTKTSCPSGKCSHKSGRLLDVSEMAELLNVPKSWIYERTRQGQGAIPHIKLGAYVRFEADEVIAFFKSRRVGYHNAL